MTAGNRCTSNCEAIRDAAFSKARPVWGNRGQGEIPSSGEGWAIAMSWPTLPLRTSEVHASIIETNYRDLATRVNRRARRWTARVSQMWSARSCFETAFNSVRTWSIWL